MLKSKKSIAFLLLILLAFYLLAYPFNGWLSATMPRHQIIQLPAMVALGLITGVFFIRLNIKDLAFGIAILIFIMASFVFWMLPRSIDLAVFEPNFNRLMLLNMFINGVLLIAVLRNILFEIEILFLGMLSAMLLVSGFTLRTFDILLCSSFNIFQQRQTGLYWIVIGVLLFLVTFFIFFKGIGHPKKETGEAGT